MRRCVLAVAAVAAACRAAEAAARPAMVEVPAALTPTECGSVVAHAARLRAERGQRRLSRYRRGTVELTGRAVRLPWLDERLRALAPGVLGGASGELLGELELVRVQQYSSSGGGGGGGGAARAWHRCVDPLLCCQARAELHPGFHQTGATRRDAENVAVSVSVQLSPPTVYVGGYLQFASTQGPLNATSQQGAAVYFRPSTLHRVAPVWSTEARLSLVAWFRIPDELFWGRAALLSANPCVQVFPLLSPSIPASFRRLPLPAVPSVLVSAARMVEEAGGSINATDTGIVVASVTVIAVENSQTIGPPRDLCVESPWPSGVELCATSTSTASADAYGSGTHTFTAAVQQLYRVDGRNIKEGVDVYHFMIPGSTCVSLRPC